MERRTIGQLEIDGIAGPWGAPRGELSTESAGSQAVVFQECVVEASDAGVAARESDVGDRESRFGEELLGQEETTGLKELNRGGAELFLHDTPDLAAAQLKRIGEFFQLESVPECESLNPGRDGASDPLGVVDGSAAWSEFRTTT